MAPGGAGGGEQQVRALELAAARAAGKGLPPDDRAGCKIDDRLEAGLDRTFGQDVGELVPRAAGQLARQGRGGSSGDDHRDTVRLNHDELSFVVGAGTPFRGVFVAKAPWGGRGCVQRCPGGGGRGRRGSSSAGGGSASGIRGFPRRRRPRAHRQRRWRCPPLPPSLEPPASARSAAVARATTQRAVRPCRSERSWMPEADGRCQTVDSGAARSATVLPVDRPGDEDVGAQRAAEHVPHGARSVDAAPSKIDAGRHAHLVQHRDEVLGGDVAGRPGRHRAPAELAEARLERLAPPPRARRARWPGPGRACCGSGRSARRRAERARGRRAKNSRTCRGLAMPVVSPKPISSQPARGQPLGDLEHALGRHLALVGTAEATSRSRPRSAGPRLARAAEHALEPGQRLGDRAVDVLAVVGLARRERKTLTSSKRSRMLRARGRGPRSFGISTEKATPVGDVDRVEHLARRRRAAGSRRARTKLVTSIRRSPVRGEQRRSARTLSAVAITSGSFWKPSRGPTSRIRTAAGRTCGTGALIGC